MAAIVVTPIMKRAQDMKCSREIIFIDSSSSVDTTNTTITNILSPSKAGAIPLAIMIHEGQTEESYIGALSLLQKNFPNCFGGIEVKIHNTLLIVKVTVLVEKYKLYLNFKGKEIDTNSHDSILESFGFYDG